MAASVELIAYAPRLGGDLGRLREILVGPLAGLFAGVHVLPFYLPFDGADAGFDPQDHTEVDPRLGSWDDIAALARDGYAVMADLIVNHVSCASTQFADWLAQGPRSAYDGVFLTFGSVFPGGAREEDLVHLRTPSPMAASAWPGPRSPRSRSTSTSGTRSPRTTCWASWTSSPPRGSPGYGWMPWGMPSRPLARRAS